jgi:hypothetical protein
LNKGLVGKVSIFSLILIVLIFLFSLNASLVNANGAPKNPCDLLKFCFADAFNTGNNESVVICAGTPVSVNWFNIWYNGTQLNNTNGGILGVRYYNYNDGYNGAINGTNYNNEPINNNTNPPCVLFVLNGTNAPFTNKTIQINGTVYNKTDYSSASSECNQNGCNGTMFTINYVSIETKNADGSGFLPNTPLMAFNNTTKTFIMNGPALTDSNGYWAEHCWGVVQGGNCINATPYGNISSNWCFVHGIRFPLNNSDPICPINQTTMFYGLDFLSSNMSSQQTITPGTPLVMNLGTPSSMSMIMASDWNPDNQMQQMSMSNLNSVNVYDYNTNNLLFSLGGGGGQGGGPPAFLQPYTLYKINFSYGGTNYNFPFMTPIAGMTGAQVLLANNSSYGPSDYRTIVGKVVNESKNANGDYYPVAGAVVYAQFFKGPGGAFGIQFFNSSVTDSNGIFTMRIPRSRTPDENPQGGNMYFPLWQFYIVSNQTNNGVPIYFPTMDNNKNKGYFAIGDTVVLPPLFLKAGGQVDVNVTLNNASMVLSELSKFATPATGVITDGTTGKFAMTSMFSNVNPPSSMIMSLLSPNGTTPNLVVDLFGKNNSLFGGGDPMSGSIVSACFNNSFNVTQGARTNIICNLTSIGYLNLTVRTCQDIFTQSGCNMQMQAGRFDFWFEMNGVIRNSNNQVVAYLSPEGILLENLIGQGQSDAIRIPLPPGNYTLELASPLDYSRYLGVYNRTTFAITAGATTILNLTRANSWNIQPMFNPSLVRSGNNSLNISITNMTGNLLSNGSIILTGKVLKLSKFAANNTPIIFNYDPNRSVFYNNTFDPSSYTDVSGNALNGKYLFLFNATNVTNNISYSTNQLMPINIYDFQVGVDLGGFTFGTGQNISAKVFAYNTSTNPPTGLNATVINTSSSNITTTIYDESGAQVTSVVTSASNLTNGQGTVNITLPGTLGFYEIVTSVTTDSCFSAGCTNNTVGVADNWVQVSNLNVKLSTDKQNYQTTDTVALAVQITNATNGSAITGVSIEAVVDNGNTPSLGTTVSDGKAIINLNPSILLNSSGGTWSYGWHSIKVKISGSVGTNVFKVDTWSGFDVRGFDLFLRSDKPSYGTTDNVTISAYGPLESFSITEVKVDSTTLTQGSINNCNVTVGVTFCIDTAWGAGSNNIKIGNWSVGHHNVVVTISFGGGQQKVYTGFDVSNYNIIATTDNFAYDLNQNITLSVKASYTNGTALNNTNVVATLFKAQPPNDIFVTQVNNTTDSTGQTILRLNATQPGFNFIKINVSGQLQFIGVQVSSIKVTLLNATGGSTITNYNAAPGSATTIYVNATNATGANVPDGSTITASIWAFGNRVELPSNTTTNGNTTIPIQIPSFAPSQVYGLEIRVTTPSGEQGFAPPATLTVAGGSALQLSASTDRSFSNPYKLNDTAILTASLTYPNGTGISGYNITFEIGSEEGKSQTIGTAVTGSSGTATQSFNIATNYTDGPYFLHAYITNNTDVKAYSGFLISSLKVNIVTDRSNNTYTPGENITLNITLLNRTSGSEISATNGFAFIFNKEKGQIQQTISTSGSQPYQTIIAIPNESSAVGTLPIGVIMFSNQSQGIGFIMIDVKNASRSLNLTLPSSITAGTSFFVNISSSQNGTASLRVFSPTASSLIYENTSVALSATATPNATINLTISNPGVYVFNVFVSGIGSTTSVVNVNASSTGAIPTVWTGTSLSANATMFTTSQDVYVMSNTANATATTLTVDTTTNTTISSSLPLTLNSSTTYYNTFSSSNLVSGRKYFVRLDTSTATGIANTMFTVS